MNYQNPIYTEETQCQDCYKCIRECPVKAILVENGHAKVIPEKCVLCGHCVTVCPAGAKHVRDDLLRARQLLKLKERVIVSLAPSFAAEFPGIASRQLVAAIRALGFFGVSETAIGADLVSAQLACDFVADPERKLYLSSACPVAVEYIKLYMPEFAPFITDRASPLLAHARMLRSRYGSDIGVVFVGPCIAKKREADVWGTIDCAISFKDLRDWFATEKISLDAPAFREDLVFEAEGFIPYRAAKGSLFPLDGGMLSAIRKYPGTECLHMMSVTGLGEIERSLSGLDATELGKPLFMELLACPGGCVNGPLMTTNTPTSIKHIALLDYASTAEDMLHEIRPKMDGTLPVEPGSMTVHADEEIRGALRQVGKADIQDELNCGSCGYDTCRAFAVALLEHRAEKVMCVSYMRKLAQKKANGIIKAIPSGVVIVDSDLRIIECNENFAILMGDDTRVMFEAKPGMEGASLEMISGIDRFFRDVMSVDGHDVVEHELREGSKIFQTTVFSIEKGESACGVIHDITAPQIQKDRVIKKTRRVINKNLAVVQKIAFLLGENAAETEATLNSIIESFTGKDEGNE